MGDRFHLKLNILRKPIAKKYCEGKVKRTLKRELKVLEIVKREANRIGKFFLEEYNKFYPKKIKIMYFFLKKDHHIFDEI